jgi:hypothetical protein
MAAQAAAACHARDGAVSWDRHCTSWWNAAPCLVLLCLMQGRMWLCRGRSGCDRQSQPGARAQGSTAEVPVSANGIEGVAHLHCCLACQHPLRAHRSPRHMSRQVALQHCAALAGCLDAKAARPVTSIDAYGTECILSYWPSPASLVSATRLAAQSAEKCRGLTKHPQLNKGQ